jgi:4-hydroxybenzoate polyprenyltransferase
MIKAAFSLFFRKLRLSEPWNYKAPFLICVPYLFLYAGDVPFPAALLAISCSFITIIGIAGFGYFCNDVADSKADLKAGIPNGTHGLTKLQVALIFIFFIGIALAPWIFYFPLTWTSAGLLLFQFLLFVVYAVPPFRLKERGLWGLVTDALYAHALPALLAAYTFYLLTGSSYPSFGLLLATLVGWQLFLGLRNILQHQILDASNDRNAGSKTYAVKVGERAAFQLMRLVFVPMELLGLAAFTFAVSLVLPAMAVVWPLYLLVSALIVRYHWKQALFTPLHDRLYFFMDDYRLKWLPLVFLVALCFHDVRMVLLLAMHLALFDKNIITRSIIRAGEFIKSTGRPR